MQQSAPKKTAEVTNQQGGQGDCTQTGQIIADESQQPATTAEIGGRQGPDPVRFGDWEKNGRCIDF